MSRIEIHLSYTGRRQLDWQSPAYHGESATLRVIGDDLDSATAATSYLLITDSTGAALAAAGPFVEIEGEDVTSWDAAADLATEALETFFEDEAAHARLRAYSWLVDTSASEVIGSGDCVLVNNPYATGGTTPSSDTVYVKRADLAEIDVSRPASLTSLADKLAEILEALKG